MNIYEKIRMLHNIYLKNNFFIKKKTYSMDNEDLFIDNFFKNKVGLYVDVGAYHPLELSNTYLLYKKNGKVLILILTLFQLIILIF